MKNLLTIIMSILLTISVVGQQDSINKEQLLQSYSSEIEKTIQILSFQTKDERSKSDKIIMTIKENNSKEFSKLFQKLETYYFYQTYQDVESYHTFLTTNEVSNKFFSTIEKNIGKIRVTDVLVENFKRNGEYSDLFEVKGRIKINFEGNDKKGYIYIFLNYDFDIMYLRLYFNNYDRS